MSHGRLEYQGWRSHGVGDFFSEVFLDKRQIVAQCSGRSRRRDLHRKELRFLILKSIMGDPAVRREVRRVDLFW